MIRTERFTTDSGIELVRTFSDDGYRIIQNGSGIVYDEAIDPVDAYRTYTESYEMIKVIPENTPFDTVGE